MLVNTCLFQAFHTFLLFVAHVVALGFFYILVLYVYPIRKDGLLNVLHVLIFWKNTELEKSTTIN